MRTPQLRTGKLLILLQSNLAPPIQFSECGWDGFENYLFNIILEFSIVYVAGTWFQDMDLNKFDDEFGEKLSVRIYVKLRVRIVGDIKNWYLGPNLGSEFKVDIG